MREFYLISYFVLWLESEISIWENSRKCFRFRFSDLHVILKRYHHEWSRFQEKSEQTVKYTAR